MNQAVFLDRDGVINFNVLNTVTGEWDSPHQPKDLRLFPWTISSIKALQDLKFKLFLISNQPSYAKGKTSLENLIAVQEKLHKILTDNKICFTDYFYCFHHPKGIVPEYTTVCECRKPGTLFIQKAAQEHMLDLKNSWMIGDRETDIECGQRMGLKTVRIKDLNITPTSPFKFNADHTADNLLDAAGIIKEVTNVFI